jgi:hypothetical protein
MRVLVEFEVHGATIDEVVENAESVWRELKGENSKLPSDTEFSMVPNSIGAEVPSAYRATVFARVKIEK